MFTGIALDLGGDLVYVFGDVCIAVALGLSRLAGSAVGA
jgi:hypothetical protein